VGGGVPVGLDAEDNEPEDLALKDVNAEETTQ
jgi:hypothetical protein